MPASTISFSEIPELSALGGTDKVLSDADSRDMLVELHDRRGGKLTVLRGRLLAVLEDRLVITEPHSIGCSLTLEPGRLVEVYLSVFGQIYRFDSTVIEPRIIAPLNRGKRIVGTTIKRPTRVHIGQRRTNFRVSLTGSPTIDVECLQWVDAEGSGCPLDAVRFVGTAVNGSEGGIAVSVPTSQVLRLRIGDYYRVRFKPPLAPREIEVSAEARHTRVTSQGQITVIGLMFLPSTSILDMQRALRPFMHFLNEAEREMRRRQRETAA